MNCAMRYDAATRSHVPLTTRSGSPVGKRVFEPAPLESGQRITPKAVSAFEGYYSAQAGNYLELFATDIGDPVFAKFTPDVVSEASIASYAFHELFVYTEMMFTEANPANHRAVIDNDPSFRWMKTLNNLPVDDEDVHQAVVKRLFKICDYLLERPELKEDLARLSSFHLLKLVTENSRNGTPERLMNMVFHLGSMRGLSFLSKLAEQGKTVADLGPGSSGLFYVLSDKQLPRMILPDFNPFITSLYRKVIETAGKKDQFLPVDIDFTKPSMLDSIQIPMCGHVQACGATHHFTPVETLDFSEFVNRILSPGGTFSISDFADEDRLILQMVLSLRDRGLSAELVPGSIYTEKTSDGPKKHFEIEGSKPV